MDLLRAAGLRENDLTDVDAMRVAGPTGMLDAFQLATELEVNTSDVTFNLIGADIPSSFAVFTVLNLYRYTGPILSVTEGLDPTSLLSVSVDRFSNAMYKVLNISLPGLETVRVAIPSTTADDPFQNIGIRLKDTQLVVTINCSVFSVVNLDNPADMLILDDGVITILGSEATVSIFFCV